MAQPATKRPARWLAALALVAALCVLAFAWRAAGSREAGATGRGTPIGMFTTLPILWNESADVAAVLSDQRPAHWARAALQRHGAIVGLDTLGASLRGLDRLIMAQPRPLSGAENVALDRWVRGGGRLLLFADPMLTGDSAFALGDKRRPQAVVLLSPILTRWGLDLEFDENQPAGERSVALDGSAYPVDLPGAFRLRRGSRCTIAADGLVARCKIQRGTVVAIADAALLDDPVGDDVRSAALDRVLTRELAGR